MFRTSYSRKCQFQCFCHVLEMINYSEKQICHDLNLTLWIASCGQEVNS